MTADILIYAFLLVPAGLAALGLVLVYLYREQLEERSQYLYYGSILGVVISGVFFYFSFILSRNSLGPSIILAGVAVLELVVVYRHREKLKSRSQYVYYGLILSSAILGVIVFYILLTVQHYTYVSGCSTDLCVFEGGLCTLVSITFISVTIVSFALLYPHPYQDSGSLKENSPYVFYGSMGFIFLVGVAAVLISTYPIMSCGGPAAGVGVSIDQNPEKGTVSITMVDTGNLDSWGLVGPDGTESTMADFQAGTTIRLRSNERVISYLNNPENNTLAPITVPTTSGTKTVENVSELPSEYQKAPDGLINPDADISGYDNTSVATVACLIDHTGIEMGGRKIPANVSIPCNAPVLAQNDSVKVGTSVKPKSGPNAGKTLTSPITLRSGGEYTVVGIFDGEEVVIQSFVVEED